MEKEMRKLSEVKNHAALHADLIANADGMMYEDAEGKVWQDVYLPNTAFAKLSPEKAHKYLHVLIARVGFGATMVIANLGM
jgi:hypothetical protein